MAWNARLWFDCVRFILAKMYSTLTLTMIRWYMSNDQCIAKTPRRIESQIFIILLIFLMLFLVFCRVFFQAKIRFDSSRLKGMKANKLTIPFLLYALSVCYILRTVLYRELVFLPLFSNQLVYENEGRIIFSDILRVGFQLYYFNCLWIIVLLLVRFSFIQNILSFRIDFYAFMYDLECRLHAILLASQRENFRTYLFALIFYLF